MSKKTKLDYSKNIQELNGKASSCPYCGSDNLNFEGPDVEDESVYYDVTCCDCDAIYKEYYNLNFSGLWGYPKMNNKKRN